MKNLFRLVTVAILVTIVFLTAGCQNEIPDDNSKPKLSAPQNLTAVAMSTDQISLSWTPVDGANVYSVYRTTDSSWQSYMIVGHYYVTEVDNTGLSSNTTYYYKIGAREIYSNDPVGELSEAASATTFAKSTDTGPYSLPAPQNLTAASISTSQINLSWTPVDSANVYSVYRTTDSTWQNFSLISPNLSSTVYSDYSLSSNTTYYYKVGAKRGSTSPVGELSESVSATTRSTSSTSGNLIAPENLTATAHGKIITLKWDAVEDASSYRIYGSFSSGGTFVYIGYVSYGTAFNVISMAEYGPVPLEPNTTYYFKVCASGGELSSEVQATTGS
jgi:fibronectin type 3 domain-containing protein